MSLYDRLPSPGPAVSLIGRFPGVPEVVPPGEDPELDTFGGPVDVLRGPKAEVTALGP
jgi:hypothetical protein